MLWGLFVLLLFKLWQRWLSSSTKPSTSSFPPPPPPPPHYHQLEWKFARLSRRPWHQSISGLQLRSRERVPTLCTLLPRSHSTAATRSNNIKFSHFENSFDFVIAYYHLWISSISVAPNLLSFQVQFPLFPFPLQQTNIAQPTDSTSANSSVGIESSFVKVFKYAFHLFPLVLWLL